MRSVVRHMLVYDLIVILRAAAAALAVVALAACVGAIDESPEAGEDVYEANAPVATELVQLELAALAQAPLGAPPTQAAVQALVANGFPKPASSDPAVQERARHAHETLMRWGHELLNRALLAATSDDPDEVREYALVLRASLTAWVSSGTWFGDLQDGANYGNLPLEMTWFLGNAARAASLLEALSAEPGSGATGIWTAADHAAFRVWAGELANRYVTFAVFSAGLSNRKASQIETLARVAELDLDAARRDAALAALFGSYQQLLTAAIRDDGFIPEDSCRDKYHDQFFLASALQTRELLAAHGLRLTAQQHAPAVNRLLAAVKYTAGRNLDASKPVECATIGDANPNHDIPFWALAPRLYQSFGRTLPAAVSTMITRQYTGRVGYDLVMQWGYNALALAYGLTGDVHARRRKGIVEAERFEAAFEPDGVFEGSPACRNAASSSTDIVARPGAGGGCAISGVVVNESWDYDYPVSAGGTRPVQLLVSSVTGGRLELSIVAANGHEYLKATVDVPSTASLARYRWITASVDEPNAGVKTLRVRARAGTFELDALRFAD